MGDMTVGGRVALGLAGSEPVADKTASAMSVDVAGGATMPMAGGDLDVGVRVSMASFSDDSADIESTGGIGVNFDPANLVMRGFDLLEAVRELFPLVVHTHAKDGVREGEERREVPLGEGQVDFPTYVGLMRELGYDGAYTIERETGDDPVGDIRKAVEFLKSL